MTDTVKVHNFDAIGRVYQERVTFDLRWKGGVLQQRVEVVEFRDGKPFDLTANNWRDVPTAE